MEGYGLNPVLKGVIQDFIQDGRWQFLEKILLSAFGLWTHLALEIATAVELQIKLLNANGIGNGHVT
jgi:hypothetical protein